MDGALKIPFVLDNILNFGNIEEEILSRKLPESWGSIEIGLICYQISSIAKADQYDLKASGSSGLQSPSFLKPGPAWV